MQSTNSHIKSIKQRTLEIKTLNAASKKVRHLQRELVRLSFSQDYRPELYKSLLRSIKTTRAQIQ
ncbi:MAG: hypothetical protein L3J52_00615 [Proteobacteria bacterium]|nr:hypothetical protein [Pseudomonadota bacterium]